MDSTKRWQTEVVEAIYTHLDPFNLDPIRSIIGKEKARYMDSREYDALSIKMNELSAIVIALTRDWKRLVNEHENVLITYRHPEPVEQRKRNEAGFAALKMAASIFGRNTNIRDMIQYAVNKGITKANEDIRSAAAMTMLCRKFVRENKQHCVRTRLPDEKTMIEEVHDGHMFLLPYLAEGPLGEPVTDGGCVHWALLCGVLEMVNNCEECLGKARRLTERIFVTDYGSEKCHGCEKKQYLVAFNGAHKGPNFWKAEQLHKSCLQSAHGHSDIECSENLHFNGMVVRIKTTDFNPRDNNDDVDDKTDNDSDNDLDDC